MEPPGSPTRADTRDSDEEDYRWPILRKNVPKWFFHLFNLTFIGKTSSNLQLRSAIVLTLFPKAITQNLVLFVVTLPIYEAAKRPRTSLEASDYVLFVIGLVTNAIEFTADNQHQSFHKYKAAGEIDKNEWIGVSIQWTPEDAKRGFITKGLWAWSRHPNFACEQLCWVSTRRTQIQCDTSADTWDLDYHQPVPGIRQFLCGARTGPLRRHTSLGYRTCSRVLLGSPRVDTVDGSYHFRKVPWIQGLPTAGQYVRSMAYPPLELRLAAEGKEGRD